jgi:Protein of unknown function (DUF2000).
MAYNYKDKKIVALLADNIELWQAMNALGHMATALGANKDEELMGRNLLVDKSGNKHLGIARYGFIIKKADSNSIKKAVIAMKSNPNVITVDFPQEMLNTRHDDELTDSIALRDCNDFEYLGALFYGPTAEVDKLTKKYSLWKQ